MATNVFTRLPEVGDAVVGELATKKVKFIKAETFSLAELDAAIYETIGVVYARRGIQVKIIYKENEYRAWMSRLKMKLSGYTLDGMSHVGTISFYTSPDERTDIEIAYSTTNIQGFVDILNAAFSGNTTLTAQKWQAYNENGNVIIEFDYKFAEQTSNTASSGFTSEFEFTTGMTPLTSIRRKHGGEGNDGSISCIRKALDFYKASTSLLPYQGYVQTRLSQLKDREYPISLESYLGDNCIEVRNAYGEGEEGWAKTIKAYVPVLSGKDINGIERTRQLALILDHNGESIYPAFYYCSKVSTVAIPEGNWYLPTIQDLKDIMDVIALGEGGDRNADAINRMLQIIGGRAIYNTNNTWSCVPRNNTRTWMSDGAYGLFNNTVMCYTWFIALAVTNYYIND